MAERGCDVRVSQRTPGSPQVGPSPDRKYDSSPELRRNKCVEFKISELLRPAGNRREPHMRGERGIGGGGWGGAGVFHWSRPAGFISANLSLGFGFS